MKTESRKRRDGTRAGGKKLNRSAELRALAQLIEGQLNLIQRRMRKRLTAEYARGHLTGPQRLVMSALVRTDGLSLKKLSEAVSLAHSTVSGIADRLEKQGMLERQPHATDRRVTVLVASQAVREFLAIRKPDLSIHPLLEALSEASARERDVVTAGLDTLVRLLEANDKKD